MWPWCQVQSGRARVPTWVSGQGKGQGQGQGRTKGLEGSSGCNILPLIVLLSPTCCQSCGWWAFADCLHLRGYGGEAKSIRGWERGAA